MTTWNLGLGSEINIKRRKKTTTHVVTRIYGVRRLDGTIEPRVELDGTIDVSGSTFTLGVK